MGKKYIIELLDDCPSEFKGIIVFGLTPDGQILAEPIPVEDLTPHTEPDLEQVRKEAYEDGYKTAKVQCNIQAEKDMRDVGERHYQRGLSDAWDAARTLWNTTNRKEIFGYTTFSTVLTALTAQKGIEKIRKYEQRQEEIRVGDEVKLKCGDMYAVYMGGVNGSNEYNVYLFFNDGSCGVHSKSEIECKTGRHFHEIAEVLQKMKENSDG